MVFRDRLQAARHLETQLSYLKSEKPVVLGVPRGALPMAKIICDALGGELDLILVHKFSLPAHPEFALGSVTEDGHVFLNPGSDQYVTNETDLADAAEDAVAALQLKRRLYTPHRHARNIKGRTVILVDDGIATGATMIAGVRFAKEKGAARVVVATPVASNEAIDRLQREGAEVVVSMVPDRFYAVSQFYEDFSEVTDSEVVRILTGEIPETKIHLGDVTLRGFLTVPDRARGIVLFAHGSGSGRFSARNLYVAKILNQASIATLLVDLLDESESENRRLVFNIEELANRLVQIEDWIAADPTLAKLPLGLFGASTGAAAAISAAAGEVSSVCAVVSRGGRPDLAPEHLELVRAPTLLIIGGDDEPVLTWNRMAFSRLKCQKELVVIDGATHLFEEPGTLEQVATLAQHWFERYLIPATRKHSVDKSASRRSL